MVSGAVRRWRGLPRGARHRHGGRHGFLEHLAVPDNLRTVSPLSSPLLQAEVTLLTQALLNDRYLHNNRIPTISAIAFNGMRHLTHL